MKGLKKALSKIRHRKKRRASGSSQSHDDQNQSRNVSFNVGESKKVETVEFDINHLAPEHADLCLDEVLRLIDDERLLVAGEYLTKLRTIIDDYPNDGTVRTARTRILGDLQPRLELLEKRVSETREALNDFENTGEWTVAQTLFGITTSYRAADDGSLWVKLEGRMEGVSLIDQAAVVRECDLYKTWAPFCDRSSLLKELGRVELLAHFRLSIPFMSRDCAMHAYGVDAAEEGAIVLLGKSVDEWEGVEIPEVSGFNGARMDIRSFKCMLKPESYTGGRLLLISNIDPKAPLPQSFINFIMKKMAGMLLLLLQRQARKISDNPNCPHAQRIQRRFDFYHVWLKSRLDRYLEISGRTPSTTPGTLSSSSSDPSSSSNSSSTPRPSSSTSSSSPSSSQSPSPGPVAPWYKRIMTSYSSSVVWPLLELLPLFLWGYGAAETSPFAISTSLRGCLGFGSEMVLLTLLQLLFVWSTVVLAFRPLTDSGKQQQQQPRQEQKQKDEQDPLDATTAATPSPPPVPGAPVAAPLSSPVMANSETESEKKATKLKKQRKRQDGLSGESATSRRPFRSTRNFVMTLATLGTLVFCACVALISVLVASYSAAASSSSPTMESLPPSPLPPPPLSVASSVPPAGDGGGLSELMGGWVGDDGVGGVVGSFVCVGDDGEWERVASATAAGGCWSFSLLLGCLMTAVQVNRAIYNRSCR